MYEDSEQRRRGQASFVQGQSMKLCGQGMGISSLVILGSVEYMG